MNEEDDFLKEIPKIGVGILGYGFVSRPHILALKRMREVYWPPPALPECIALSGRTVNKLRDAAQRYEVKKWFADWREMLKDPHVQVFVNCATNDAHAESCIEAAKSGRHVLCEKPLARNTDEAKRMLEAVRNAGVKHMTGFNYRFVPAVRLAKELILQGAIISMGASP